MDAAWKVLVATLVALSVFELWCRLLWEFEPFENFSWSVRAKKPEPVSRVIRRHLRSLTAGKVVACLCAYLATGIARDLQLSLTPFVPEPSLAILACCLANFVIIWRFRP